MSKFWKRVTETKPQLIGSIIYFSPTKKCDLACIIHEDGTISPVSLPAQRFDSAIKLVNAWRKGDIGQVQKLPKCVKTSKFREDCFFKTGRQGAVKNIFQAESAITPNDDTVAVQAANVDGNQDEADEPVMEEDTNQHEEANVPVVEEGEVLKACYGFDIRRHLPVIKQKQWDGARMEFSPLEVVGNRCRSKECECCVVGNRSICSSCKDLQKQLWNARRSLKVERKLKNARNRWMTSEEKCKNLENQLSDMQALVREKKREIKALKKELDRYRPDYEENRPAVQSVVKKMDAEQRKVVSPVCQWVDDDGHVCGYEALSVILLVRHVREEHFEPQLEFNQGRSIMDQRTYCCE